MATLMSGLNQEQLQLLSQLNEYRVELVRQFDTDPQFSNIFQILLKMHVLLSQNQTLKQPSSLLNQSTRNACTMINRLASKAVKKKYNVAWTIPQQTSQPPLQFPSKPPSVSMNPQKRLFQQQFDKQKAMLSIKPGQFISPNLLLKQPKNTRKFVPPYKKVQQPPKGQPPIQDRLVATIQSEILKKCSGVKWCDIAGLSFAKSIINEMIIWPLLRPDIFTGVRAPPKGILLFGPPGTGKTLIGKAVASEASATFFSISASSLTSKWVGESEKLVKTLFTVARAKQPSVIFIDEIDSLLCSRSEGEQQSSRRVKTEFLIQLDGTKSSLQERVLIIGATNLPRQLDDAVRRRFTKRLYIPLPNLEGRKQLITSLTSNQTFSISGEEVHRLGEITKGYSGADLYALCSEASMMPLRKIVCIESLRNSQVPTTNIDDFTHALKMVRPTVHKQMLNAFKEFNQMYGSCQYTSQELEQ